MGLEGGGESFPEEVWYQGGIRVGSESGGGGTHLLDYAQGSLVPCMESLMTEDRLNEVKASKSWPALVRFQSQSVDEEARRG